MLYMLINAVPWIPPPYTILNSLIDQSLRVFSIMANQHIILKVLIMAVTCNYTTFHLKALIMAVITAILSL